MHFQRPMTQHTVSHGFYSLVVIILLVVMQLSYCLLINVMGCVGLCDHAGKAAK